jgi:hypothetical protein
MLCLPRFLPSIHSAKVELLIYQEELKLTSCNLRFKLSKLPPCCIMMLGNIIEFQADLSELTIISGAPLYVLRVKGLHFSSHFF